MSWERIYSFLFETPAQQQARRDRNRSAPPAKPEVSETSEQGYRRMSYRMLVFNRDLNASELAKLQDSDDPREQRKIKLMRESMGKLLREANAELARRDRENKSKESLRILGGAFGVVLWLAGCFLAYRYVGGVALAVLFWLGIVIIIVAAITVQIRDGIERRKRR